MLKTAAAADVTRVYTLKEQSMPNPVHVDHVISKYLHQTKTIITYLTT